LVKYEGPLRKRALRLAGLAGGNTQDAGDYYQETAYRVLNYSTVFGEINNPLGYMLRVMRNVWIDQQVKANKVHMESLDAMQEDPARRGELPAVAAEVLRFAKNSEFLEELRTVRAAFTRDEKCLLAAVLGGQTLEEIAASSNEDLYRTRARWYKLRAKVKRLIRGRNAQTKKPGQA
jgi:DNA-directed RNA polymerase specialized sigma24 family protein